MKHSIVIIEKNEDERGNLEELLQKRGFETISAENGTDGWDLIKKKEPFLVISNLIQDGLDGDVILSKIRKNTNHQPFFICITSVPGSNQLEKVADDYFLKPYDTHALIDSISRLKSRTNNNS